MSTFGDRFANLIMSSLPPPPTSTQQQAVAIPVHEDILAKLEESSTTMYSDDDDEPLCPICQDGLYEDDVGEGVTIVALPCNHKFHKECIFTYFKEKPHCPVCRKDVRGCYTYGHCTSCDKDFTYEQATHITNSSSESPTDDELLCRVCWAEKESTTTSSTASSTTPSTEPSTSISSYYVGTISLPNDIQDLL